MPLSNLQRVGPSSECELLNCYGCKYWSVETPVTGARSPRPVFSCKHPETPYRIGRSRQTPKWCPLVQIGEQRLREMFEKQYQAARALRGPVP